MASIPESKRIIPSEVLGLGVTGLGIEEGSFRDLVAGEATVLAFLRHFG